MQKQATFNTYSKYIKTNYIKITILGRSVANYQGGWGLNEIPLLQVYNVSTCLVSLSSTNKWVASRSVFKSVVIKSVGELSPENVSISCLVGDI